ncbi:S41 family peptidase [Chitinophaga vietnamensis]|uniref:S41 family peptidase n=1 Tax=Chitinophaga vietnamensis TaxID=2593957 RepID=UPI001178B95C|nr:S41 family peptidase [Chitinophaga vietnamensis]
MQPNRLWWLTASLALALILPACKKNDNSGSPNPTNSGNGKVSVNDSIFFIFKDIYLWTDATPDSATFKPESFSSPVAMFDSLTHYKKDASNNNLDRYSFIDDGTTSRALQGGVVGDMGFQVGFQTNTELRVVYVYPGSPADKAGIKRGWKINTINGTSSFQYGSQSTNTLLNNALGGSFAAFTFQKPDGSTLSTTLTATQYNLDPIFYSNVYTFGTTKVGYLVFNNFVALNLVQGKLDNIFSNFLTQGVTNVIIDLRYNGGGLVQTAEYLANKMAPASVNNTVMYTQIYNDNIKNDRYSWYFTGMKAVPNYPNYNWTDIFHSEATTYATTNFQSTGAQKIANLRFLVTHNTVSASELLYNVLKPSMSPRLVGRTTYGKPVGFINITFGSYDMYAVSFQSKNSAGQGDYFTGIAPDVNVQDDYTNDWGSLSDPLLHSALLDLGIPASQLGRQANIESFRLAENAVNPTALGKFKGMILERRR